MTEADDLHEVIGSDSLAMIMGERLRVVTVEGFTLSHDDHHRSGELATAAACYADLAARQEAATATGIGVVDLEVPARWPWARVWWKPSLDPTRNLVKAGQLLVGELDRINRARDGRSTCTAVDDGPGGGG